MKAVKGLIVFLISLSVFAAAVPKEQLDNVNAYIKILISAYADDYSVKIKSANRNDKTQQLDNIVLAADFKEWGKAGLKLGLVGEDVVFNVKYSFVDKEGYLTKPENIAELTEDMMQYVSDFNKKGIYKASATVSTDDKLTKIKVTVVPASKEAKSIKKMVVKIKVPHGVGSKVSLKLKGNFVAKADLVSTAQEGLTSIFTSLSNKEEPKDSDYEKLEKVMEAIMESIF